MQIPGGNGMLTDVKRIVFTSSVAIYGLDKNNPDESFPG